MRALKDQRLLPSHRAGLADLIVAHPATLWTPYMPQLEGLEDWGITVKRRGVKQQLQMGELFAADLVDVDPMLRPAYRKDGDTNEGLYNWKLSGRLVLHMSEEEKRAVTLLDFVRAYQWAHAQPFTIDFLFDGVWHEHTPDYLAVPYGDLLRPLLVDVTVTGRTEDDDRVRGYASAAALAEHRGWDYVVISGQLTPPWHVIDELVGARHPLWDPEHYTEFFVDRLRSGSDSFGALAESVRAPAIARSVLRHLLWTGDLWCDLNAPLRDSTPIHVARRGAPR